MKIEITGTSAVHGSGGLFRDLAKYNMVSRWLNDVVIKKSAWCPCNVCIRYKGGWYNLIQYGNVASDAGEVIRGCTGVIMDNVVFIKANIIASELYINLDCED